MLRAELLDSLRDLGFGPIDVVDEATRWHLDVEERNPHLNPEAFELGFLVGFIRGAVSRDGDLVEDPVGV